MAQLLEETLERPVKYAFSLSKESFALNKGFFLTFAAVLIVLGILGMIPIVNLFTSILSGILTAALTIAVGQRFGKAESIDDYIEKIKALRIGQVWSGNGRLPRFPAFNASLCFARHPYGLSLWRSC